ncbi:MAG: BMP family protein [Burkholderiales bacterium]|nr:BMP family protein [Anaerolineae bacterium]
MGKNKMRFVTLLLLLALGSIGVLSVSAQDDMVRVAIIMPSSTTDLAWSQSMYDSAVAVQTAMGGESAMEIAVSEGTFDVTAAADAARDYAEDGFDLVIMHGTQYGTSLQELAPDYPDTSFAWGTTTETFADEGLTNVFAYDVAAEEGGYVNGYMAGLLTESGVIGVVGPVPAGDAILYNNGFVQGVNASNPDADVLVAYTGSFGDTAAAAEVAQTQIAAGADILTGSAQQVPGAIDTIQAAGGLWFSTDVDQRSNWPETVAAAMVYDWTGVLTAIIENRAAGTLGGVAYELNLQEGSGLTMVYNTDIGISEDILAAGMAAEDWVRSGAVYALRTLPAEGEVFRVAIVMPSSTTDLAWSQAMVDALMNVQQQLGGEGVMEIAISEGVFDVTAAAEALRDYADEGYNLVIAHGTQYGTSLFELAVDYPDTAFAWGTAVDTGENIFAYEARAEQGGYVNGIMAGLMTESGVVGIVGPVPAGDGLLYINGFQQGVMASNPDAEILLAYTGSFGDTALAAETAQTQIAAGADVLSGSAQQVVGAIDQVQTAGGIWFGTQSDQSGNWPETVVSSQVYHWSPVVGSMIDLILSGTNGGVAYELTLENAGLDIVFGGVEVPEDVMAAAMEAADAVAVGEIVVEQVLPE